LQDASRRQIKSFLLQQFFKNAGEVWASSPHLQSKFNFALCSSCCNCIWFGRIASLSACVLFAGGYVVRIIFVFFLDFDFSEFFMFLEWRTADCLFLLDFNII